jgi:hypothetical protein
MNENESIWIILNVFFGIASVIGACLFVSCFNFAIYKRNKRIVSKVYDEEDQSHDEHALMHSDR